MESKKRIENATLRIELSLLPEDVSAFEAAAIKELSRDLARAGFRKGNVPEAVARAHLGEARIFSEAADKALRAKVGEILAQEDIDMVGAPEITVTKLAAGNPVEARVTIGVLPKIDLGDWKKIRIASLPQKVSEKEVDEALEWLRKSRAKLRAVVRPAAMDDFVEIDFETRIGGVIVEGGSGQRHPFILGEGKFVPGFEAQIVGMSHNEERSFTLPFPPEWPAKGLAGKDASFRVKLTGLQERLLPEANDAFAREVGKFENLALLRDSTRKGLLEEKTKKERRGLESRALEELGARIPDVLPQAFLDAQAHAIEEEIRASIEAGGMAFEDYLTQLQTSLEKFRSGLEVPARARAKSGLVLRTIAQQEGLEVFEEELEAETQELLRGFKDAADARRALDSEAVRSYARTRILNRKALELLIKTVTAHSELSKLSE